MIAIRSLAISHDSQLAARQIVWRFHRVESKFHEAQSSSIYAEVFIFSSFVFYLQSVKGKDNKLRQ